MDPVTFTVEGPPIPKARARMTMRGHAFTPERTRNAEALVRAAAISAGIAPRSGPVILRVLFFEADARRRDLDNMIKLVQDSLNPCKGFAGAWLDDSQIAQLFAHRSMDKRHPRTVITIADAADYPLPKAVP